MAATTMGQAAPAAEADIAPDSEQRVTSLELFFEQVRHQGVPTAPR